MTKPIRVLQVLPSLNRGGAETVVMDWFRQIDGAQVVFDFVVTNPADNYHYEAEAVALGARIIRAPLFHIKRIPSLVAWWHRNLREHPEWQVMHGHDALTTSIYLSVGRSMRRQTIAHSHSSGGDSGIDGVVRRIMRRPLRNVAGIRMACSEPAAVWMYGRRASIRIVNNGIDTERFAFNEGRGNRTRNALGLEDAFVVGHVGRLVEVKNHAKVLHVFAELLNAEPSARLLLVGNGVLRGRIESRINELGIADKVVLTGAREDVPDLLAAMDVMVLPSLYEGFPVTVVEAQASGLPCVVSDAVTREIGLTDLVRFISLDEPDDVWAKAVIDAALTGERVSRTDELRAAGYDSAQVAHEMQQLYLGLAELQAAKARR